MGTPIDPPPIVPPVAPGDPCVFCWGVGKPFGTDDTPSELTISISGINKNNDWTSALGEPVDGIFVIDQVALAACQWQFTDAGVIIDFLFRLADTQLTVVTANGFICFQRQTLDPCELVLANAGAFGFSGGTAVITIPEVQA